MVIKQEYVLCKILWLGAGGKWPLGNILREKLREKNEKGDRKTEENQIRNGGKGLKNASFWVISQGEVF